MHLFFFFSSSSQCWLMFSMWTIKISWNFSCTFLPSTWCPRSYLWFFFLFEELSFSFCEDSSVWFLFIIPACQDLSEPWYYPLTCLLQFNFLLSTDLINIFFNPLSKSLINIRIVQDLEQSTVVHYLITPTIWMWGH